MLGLVIKCIKTEATSMCFIFSFISLSVLQVGTIFLIFFIVFK